MSGVLDCPSIPSTSRSLAEREAAYSQPPEIMLIATGPAFKCGAILICAIPGQNLIAESAMQLHEHAFKPSTCSPQQAMQAT